MQGIKGSFNGMLLGHRSRAKENKNISTNAVELYKAAAESGHADAQYEYGMCLKDGNGIAKNEAESIKWFQKAADNGNIDAKFCLAVAFLTGNFVEQDYYKSTALLRECCEKDHTYGKWLYGVCLVNGKGVAKDEKQGFLYLTEASEKGCRRALQPLAGCYYLGLGTERNIAKAKELYMIVVNDNSRVAQRRLGEIYVEEKNYLEAEKWYLKGAQNDDVNSMYCIASMYVMGEGIDKNYDKAIYWAKKACDNNAKEAELLLACVHDDLKRSDTRRIDIIDYLKNLDDKHDGMALYALAGIYSDEEEKKVNYLKKSAAAGCELAREVLDEARDAECECESKSNGDIFKIIASVFEGIHSIAWLIVGFPFIIIIIIFTFIFKDDDKKE